VITYDLGALTRQVFGRASALSAGLAAAAARLTLEVASADIEKNIGIGERVFGAISPAQFVPVSPPEPEVLVTATYQTPLLASPSILHGGNAALRQTGAWRVERPVVDRDACSRCGLCFVMCPDGAIQLDALGYPVVDYDHCKGCMICQRLCPLQAIDRQLETQAW
jgi:2-oxoacid:acceptor oxidoreductase delta subunit (pyruvate/2-ketoisovalerate family)